MSAGPVARWDIYWVELERRVEGDRDDGGCPAIVVSNDGFNAHFDVVTVVPLKTCDAGRRRAYEFEVLLPADTAGIKYESIAMPHQIRTISKTRLGDRVGILADEPRRLEIEDRLLEHLAVTFMPKER